MTALIFRERFCFNVSASLFVSSVKLAGSMSTSSGSAPASSMAMTVATAVCETVMTVSPAQRQHERVRAVRHADRVRSTNFGGKFFFKRVHFRAKNIMPAVANTFHRGENLAFMRAILGDGLEEKLVRGIHLQMYLSKCSR